MQLGLIFWIRCLFLLFLTCKHDHCRYKALCPDTWPHWNGTPAEGVQQLIKHLGYKPNEYKMGRYKLGYCNDTVLFF